MSPKKGETQKKVSNGRNVQQGKLPASNSPLLVARPKPQLEEEERRPNCAHITTLMLMQTSKRGLTPSSLQVYHGTLRELLLKGLHRSRNGVGAERILKPIVFSFLFRLNRPKNVEGYLPT